MPCRVQGGGSGGSGGCWGSAVARGALARLVLLLRPDDEAALRRVAASYAGVGEKTCDGLLRAAAQARLAPMSIVERLSRGGGGAATFPGLRLTERARASLRALGASHAALAAMLRGDGSGNGDGVTVQALLRAALDAAPPPSAAAASSAAGGAEDGGGDGEGAGAEVAARSRETLLAAAAAHDAEFRPESPTDAAAAATAGEGGGEPPAEPAARQSLRCFVQQAGLGVGSDTAAAGASYEVTLCTIHRAKGLEWRCVWLPCLEDGVMPHARGVREASAREARSDAAGAGVAGGAGGGGGGGGVATAADALSEEQRLLYVAITRSRAGLVLSRALWRTGGFGGGGGGGYGGSGGEQARPCPFLRALPTADCVPRLFLSEAAAGQLEPAAKSKATPAAEKEQLRRKETGAAAWQERLDAAARDAAEGRHPAQVAAFFDRREAAGSGPGAGSAAGGGGGGGSAASMMRWSHGVGMIDLVPQQQQYAQPQPRLQPGASSSSSSSSSAAGWSWSRGLGAEAVPDRSGCGSGGGFCSASQVLCGVNPAVGRVNNAPQHGGGAVLLPSKRLGGFAASSSAAVARSGDFGTSSGGGSKQFKKPRQQAAPHGGR